MPSAQVRVGLKGRVVIPHELRETLDIEPGTSLVAYVEGSRLVLENRRALVERARGSLSMPDGRSAVDDLLASRHAEAELEDAEASCDAAAIERAREQLAAVSGAPPPRRQRAG
ncbi:MAG: AbrB/MazE/SpoVT family DNA-binding domain-containing protein [Acidimicrobiales bacterium]